MDIYVVQEGDSIYSIAEDYGVSVNKLIQDNGLNNPLELVIGQTIVIVNPKQKYIVQEGDTLNSIANTFNVSIMQILKNNPSLSDREYFYPGETIVISYYTNGSIATHGYTYSYIKKESLVKVLPSLTYLSIFNYTAIEGGKIIEYYEDAEIIQLAKDYGTVPLMMMTTLTTKGEQNIDTEFEILINEDILNSHINNILDIMKTKGFYGVNIVINYINAINQSTYLNFIKKLSNRLLQEGYLFFITFNLNMEGIYKESVDYSAISRFVNGMIFLQLVWGTNLGPPSPVNNIDLAKTFIDHIVPTVPPDKIILGSTTISYDWQLPYIPYVSSILSLTIDSAIKLAYNVGAEIQFDETSQTPFFLYNQITTGNPTEHIVWSIDARTIDAQIKLIKEYGLNGIGIWNIMIYYFQMWTIINSQYEIIKIIPLS